MQKAHIILYAAMIFAVVGSGMAFKLVRFIDLPIWHHATYNSPNANGTMCATNLCTQWRTTLCNTTAFVELLTIVDKTAAILPQTVVVGTTIDVSGFSTAIFTFPATTS